MPTPSAQRTETVSYRLGDLPHPVAVAFWEWLIASRIYSVGPSSVGPSFVVASFRAEHADAIDEWLSEQGILVQRG